MDDDDSWEMLLELNNLDPEWAELLDAMFHDGQDLDDILDGFRDMESYGLEPFHAMMVWELMGGYDVAFDEAVAVVQMYEGDLS